MRKEDLFDIIGEADGQKVAAAGMAMTIKKSRLVRIKWVTAAACLCLATAIAFSFIANRLKGPDKTAVDSVIMIFYENSLYEIIEDSPKTLEKYGLKAEITEREIGEHISYLQKETPDARRSDYIVSDRTNGPELLEYAPASHKAVRIFKDGDNYFYALFCNYTVDYEEFMPISYAFEVNGVFTANDIIRITPVRNDNSFKAIADAITQRNTIDAFYNAAVNMEPYSQKTHHDLVFADELAEAEEIGGDIGTEVYTKYADNRNDLLIETKDGIRFVVSYYPSYGWIYMSETMSYYKMNTSMIDWFENNL